MEARPTDITKKYGLDTKPISLRPNIDPEYFELEKEKIFKHAWLNVGRVEDVPNPGDWTAHEVHILDTSVIVVRGRDGVIRAFHNMCQHRGNKVVHAGENCGQGAKGFSCTFHGWTYDLQGKLVIVPDEDQFFNLDKSKRGLKPIACDIWEGFIFISGDPKESLKEWMGELYDKFTGYFDNAYRFQCYKADVKVNWKVVLDAFQEAYHAPFLHGKSYPDQMGWTDNYLAHALGLELYEKHRALSIEMNPSSDPSPIAKTLLDYTQGTVFQAMATEDKDFNALPPGINPTRDTNWGFDIYVIFPMFYLAPTRSMHFVTYHFWPVAVDRTIWQTDHYVVPAKNAGDRLAQEMSKAFGRDVQREDLITLENTQSMLNSGAMTHMPISDQEVACRHNYRLVEEWISR